MNTFNVTELQDDFFFTEDAFLDKKFLLLTPGMPITAEFRRALRDWEFLKIYSEGRTTNDDLERKTISVPPEAFDEYDEEHKPVTKDDATETMEPVSQSMNQVEKNYNEFQSFIADVYTRYVTRKDLQPQVISDKVKDLCDFIRENKRLILRIQPSQESRDKNYLVVHSMRSTVFAIVIGLQLKFPIHKLIELGVSCILHEIGMVRLPPQVYMGKKELILVEKNAIFTHPVISYNILREFSFPLNICLGVLEHHERENGGGYPRNLV